MLADVSTERSRLIQVDTRNNSCPTSVRVISQVAGLTVVIGYIAATQLAKDFFEKYPGLVCVLGLTAGGARVLITTFMAPNAVDRRIYEYLTKFDTLIFLGLAVTQQVSDKYPPLNSICYPLMYIHEGGVLFWDGAKKLQETKGSHPEYGILNEMRPLIEGDTRGSIRPFLIKGAVMIAVGGGIATAGVFTAGVAAFRLGLILAGTGAAIPCVQPLYSKMGKVMEDYVRLTPAEKLVLGDIPLKQRMLTFLSRFAPIFGKVGICSTGALLVALPLALEKIEFRSGLINAALSIPLALVDVGSQDAFQYPSYAIDEVQEGREEVERASCFTRVWKDMKKRPEIYVGVAATIAVTGATVAAQQFNPAVNGPLAASLILGGAITGFAAAKGVEVFCPPGAKRLTNQINFLLAKRAHLFVIAFLALYDSYLWDALSPVECGVMWGLYGTFIGLFLKQVLDR